MLNTWITAHSRLVKQVSSSIVFGALVLILLKPTAAIACSCWSPPSTDEMAQEWWNISQAIVLGTVTSIEPVDITDSHQIFRKARIKLDVIEAIRGLESESEAKVLVTFIGCGPNLRLGQTYLLVAMQFSRDEPLTNEGCGAWVYEEPGASDDRARHRKEYIEGFMERFRRIARQSPNKPPVKRTPIP